MPLSLRCATALFGHFGIEWDITGAAEEELAELAAWIQLYKQHRALIHAGRVVRIDTPDDTAWMHGVVAADASAALMSYVQLDEPRNDQPAALRIPGLDPRRRYQVTEVTPGARGPRRSGLAIAPQRTLTAVVVLIEAV
jgi:alpha-galactosidase